MKKKINSINGKRLVIGNANEITKDEILVQQTKDGLVSLKERVGGELKELSGGSTSGSGGNTNYKYYLIDTTSMNYLVSVYSSLIKYKSKRNGEICIASTPYVHQSQELDLLSCRVNLNDRMYEGSWTTIFDVVTQLESLYGKLTEITEEEFYNLNL